ncbi:MAG: chromo domain-containing protein, partial [bacterium]
MTSPVTVWFRPVAGQAEADSAHVDNTKAFVSTKGKEMVLTSYVGAPSSLEEEEVNEVSDTEEQAPEERWVVERVMDYKLTKGVMQFLVRWKGFTADEDSWIPEGDMSCHHL